MVEVFRFVSPGYAVDTTWAREIAKACYERDANAFPRGWRLSGAGRQGLAVLRGRNLLPSLANIRVPALVIHGEADPLVFLRTSRAIADAIPAGHLVSYTGMGHWPARELWPAITAEIAALAS